MAGLILFNKPYHVLSQFTDSEGRDTLARYVKAPGYRVAGRLDYDSEGLLLLTDDGALQQQIANPRHKLWKTYWVQVEGVPDDASIAQLVAGVELSDGPTRPARVHRIDAPDIWERVPPVRSRKTVADSWLSLSIREGRNRQVRRMTAAVGCPTLRLIRAAIGDWQLSTLAPGEYRRETIHMPRPPRGAAGRHKRGKP